VLKLVRISRKYRELIYELVNFSPLTTTICFRKVNDSLEDTHRQRRCGESVRLGKPARGMCYKESTWVGRVTVQSTRRGFRKRDQHNHDQKAA